MPSSISRPILVRERRCSLVKAGITWMGIVDSLSYRRPGKNRGIFRADRDCDSLGKPAGVEGLLSSAGCLRQSSHSGTIGPRRLDFTITFDG